MEGARADALVKLDQQKSIGLSVHTDGTQGET